MKPSGVGSRRATWVVVPGLLVVAATLFWLLFGSRCAPGDGPVGSSVAYVQAPAPGGQRGNVPREDPSTSARRRATEDTREILVTDRTDRPIPGAEAHLVPCEARVVVEPEPPIGVSDSAGLIVVAGSRLRAAVTRCVLVRAAGYVPAAIEVSKVLDRSRTHLRLQRGHSLQVSCRTRQGEPIAGVRIALTRARAYVSGTLQVASKADRFLPGPPEGAPLYVGTSDEQGNVRISGVPAGGYILYAWHEEYAVVAGLDTTRLLRVPTTPTILTFQRLYGAVVRVEGDTVLWSRIRPASGPGAAPVLFGRTWAREHGPRVSKVADLMIPMAEHRRVLLDRYPGASVAVGVLSEGVSDAVEDPGNVALHAFLVHRGCVQADVPLRPLASIREPVVLRAPELAPVSVPTGTVSLSIVQPDGTLCDPPGLFLEPKSQTPCRGVFVPIRSGRAIDVPSGAYELYVPRYWTLGRVLPEVRLEVPAGGFLRKQVKLAQRLYRRRLRIRLPDGGRLPPSILTVVEPSGANRRVINWTGGPPHDELWLPEGRTRVSLDGLGFEILRLEHVIRSGDESDGEIEMVLRYAGRSH